jgi:hypothetical protein
VLLRIQLRVFNILGKNCITELHLQPEVVFLRLESRAEFCACGSRGRSKIRRNVLGREKSQYYGVEAGKGLS